MAVPDENLELPRVDGSIMRRIVGICSTINYQEPEAGVGLFSCNNFGKGTVIGYYYVSLVYADLSGRPQQHRTYREGIMILRVEYFE